MARITAEVTKILKIGDAEVTSPEEAKLLIELLASTFPAEFDDVLYKMEAQRRNRALQNSMNQQR